MNIFKIIFSSFFRTIGRIFAYITIGGLIMFLFTKCTRAESIDFQNVQPFEVLGNSSTVNSYTKLYSYSGNSTNSFSYGTYPFMLLQYNRLDFTPYNNQNGVYSYVLQLSVCQTESKYDLEYDSGSVHDYTQSVSRLGYIVGGSCKVNVYTGQLVNYYFLVNGTKRNNENCTSNYCILGQKFVLKWQGGSYIEWSVLDQKYHEYSSDISNMLANSNAQNKTNEKLDEAENTRKGIWGTLQSVFSAIGNLPGLIWNAIKGGFEAITGAITNLFNKIVDLFNFFTDTSQDDNSGFFGDFNDTDHGGISGVITSPLRFIRKMSSPCNALNIDVLGADVEIPCGTTLFWDKPSVAQFKIVWNTIFGGALLYSLICMLYKVINNLKDPDNSKVEVMKL